MMGNSKRQFIALSILAVTLGVCASWLWAGRVSAAQQEERSDLNLFLETSSAGWAEVANQFFAVPEATAQSIGALLEEIPAQDARIALLAESIRVVPAIDAAFIGRSDGSFLFVAKSDDEVEGGFRIRSITGQGSDRRVELSWTDATLQVIRSEIATDDTYDPRERPWFIPIAQGAPTAWTDPYVFASSQQPGITHSAAVVDDQGIVSTVVGIDIRLTELSSFLDRLRPGANGEALVIDRDGTVIAASSTNLTEDGLDERGLVTRPLQDSPDLLALVAALSDDDQNNDVTRSSDGTRTTVAWPVRNRNDWYLASRARDSDFLGDVSTEPLKNLVGVLAIGIATAALVSLSGLGAQRYLYGLRQEADLDELTGLMSRRAAKRVLESLLATPSTVITAIIDLDRFKVINDEHGHAYGDMVLAEIGRRINEFTEQNDTKSGRLGGDEFVVFGDHDPDWDQLIAALSEPIVVNGRRLMVGASIGVAVTTAAGSRRIEDVLGAADQALFTAKRNGGGRFERATSTLPSSANEVD